MIPNKEKAVLVIIIAVLLATNIFFVVKYAAVQSELIDQRISADKVSFNSNVLDFESLFIEKVLKAKGEVSFEDRLHLETVVRNLNDSQILEQWNKFVNSKNEAQAQEEVKNLLGLLVSKIKK